MRICYNAPAMEAHNALTRNDNRLTESLKRLSSGLKVTEAKDNPAGMAMGKRMNMQLKGLSVATQNSSDAISAIETADGALSEVHDILQRMNVLAVKASNGTLSDADRATVEDEITQLKQEITRIADTTQFNGNTLMNGNFDLRGYTDNAQVKVGYYSDAVTAGIYEVNITNITFVDGEIDLASAQANCTLNTGFPTNAAVTKAAGNKITIVSDEFELNLKIEPNPPITGTGTETATINAPVTIDVTGIGAMTMQIGSNEGQVLDIRVPTISLDELGLTNMTMKDMQSAREAIDSIAGAIEYVSSARSRLGAYQNRLEHCVSNLDIISENMTAAYSRIMDADMADDYSKRQQVSPFAIAIIRGY